MADDLTTDPYAVPLSVDPSEVQAEQIAAVQAVIPSWTPVPGALDTILLAAAAETTVETRQAFADQLRSVIIDVVGDLWGIHRSAGLPAASTVTITATDPAPAGGYLLPAGTLVAVSDVDCETTADLTIAAGDTTGVVPIAARAVGAAANGVTGDPQPEPYDWIDTATLDAALSGGEDEETTAQLLTRAADELATYSITVSQPSDAITRAKRVPGVEWAYVLERYDITTDDDDVDGCFTVVVAGADAQPVAASTLTAVADDLYAYREANMLIRVCNPTYTEIDVTATVTALDGWDADTVAADVTDRITAYLSPARYLTPPTNLDPAWVPPRRIHVNQLIADAALALGVLRIDTLTIGDGTANWLDLSTPIDLPTPGTITVAAA
ncbi:MAG: baseplate J/gp47 family protein [Patulibacter sp.]